MQIKTMKENRHFRIFSPHAPDAEEIFTLHGRKTGNHDELIVW